MILKADMSFFLFYFLSASERPFFKFLFENPVLEGKTIKMYIFRKKPKQRLLLGIQFSMMTDHWLTKYEQVDVLTEYEPIKIYFSRCNCFSFKRRW